MPKPTLVLHPGFPKCATSYIQRLFVQKEYALSRALGVRAIGRDFIPENGYPDVTKAMYNYSAFLAELEQAAFPIGDYILSNEAISNKSHIMPLLAKRFTIRRVVFTIRFPPIAAISNFRFSGWLSRTLQEFLDAPPNFVFGSTSRFETKIKRFSGFGVDVAVCPIEDCGPPLWQRFSKVAFDIAPDSQLFPWIRTLKNTNQSISLAFAEAMAIELESAGLRNPSPYLRQSLVKLAQSQELPSDLQGLAPHAFRTLDENSFIAALLEYDELMAAWQTEPIIRAAALKQARENTRKILDTPLADPAQMRELQNHARNLILLWQAKHEN